MGVGKSRLEEGMIYVYLNGGCLIKEVDNNKARNKDQRGSSHRLNKPFHSLTLSIPPCFSPTKRGLFDESSSGKVHLYVYYDRFFLGLFISSVVIVVIIYAHETLGMRSRLFTPCI